MAEVLLFHHAQGLTTGVQAFAAELRGAGHTVHVPDLYDGHTLTGTPSPPWTTAWPTPRRPDSAR